MKMQGACRLIVLRGIAIPVMSCLALVLVVGLLASELRVEGTVHAASAGTHNLLVGGLRVAGTAHTVSTGSNPQTGGPYVVKAQCLNTTTEAWSVGPQEMDAYGEVTNNCPGTVTGRLQMYAQNTTCPPYPELSGSWSFQIYAGGTWQIPSNWQLQGGCTECDAQGNIIGYPEFYVRFSTTAFGTWGGGYGQSTSNNGPAVNVWNSNDPPDLAYEPPCP